MGSPYVCEACENHADGPYGEKCTCDEGRWTTMSPVAVGAFHAALYRDEALRTLAANLATAGALCAAFRQGSMYATRLRSYAIVDWRPGCGRPMPGWGG